MDKCQEPPELSPWFDIPVKVFFISKIKIYKCQLFCTLEIIRSDTEELNSDYKGFLSAVVKLKLHLI